MKDLTQGPISRQLIGLAGFMLVGMLVVTLYTLVDLYFVGTLGPTAVAAVTVSTNFMMVAMAFSQMLGVGTGALIAQSIGRKDHDQAHDLFGQALSMAAAAVLLFETGAQLCESAYIAAFTPDPETARLTQDYLRWFLPSLALQFPMMAMSSALRGTGNVKPGTFAQIGSVLLNIGLAPVLILGWLGGPRLGVAGAGLATLIASIVAVVGLALYFRRPETFLKFRPSRCVPDLAQWWRIARIGLPSAIEFLFNGCYMLFVTATLQPFGSVAQASFGVGQRVLQSCMLPAMAIAFATATIVGQNYGARLGERVRSAFRVTLAVNVGFMLVACGLIQSSPRLLVGIFSNDPGVLAGGTEFLHVLSFNLIAFGVAYACFGVLSGLGNTWPTLLSSATRIVLIVIPTSILSHRPGFQVVWLWYFSVAATLVQMSMNFAFVLREMRIRLGALQAPVAAAPAGPGVPSS